MTDLIRRADAIEAVWKLDKDANEYVVDDAKEIHGYCTAIGVCVGELSALPSAEAVQGWIPCSERLPDIKEHHVSDPCLVYCENGVYGFAELEENIFGQVGWNCEREDEYHEPIGEVLAWMPLPKPYKGGDE